MPTKEMIDDDIRKAFANHERLMYWQQPEVTEAFSDNIVPAMEFLRWGKRDDCNWMVEYLRCGAKLFVSGDLGMAAFRWSGNVTLAGISTYSVDYFAEKCEASATGREFVAWDESKAIATLKIRLLDGYSRPEMTRRMDLAEESGAFKATVTQQEWESWLNRHGVECLGPDCFESRFIGQVPHVRLRAYLIGLKMAFGKVPA